MTDLGSRKLHIFQKVTKMGSAIGHRIEYNGVGALRGKTRLAHTQQKFSQVPPPPRPPTGIQRTPSGPSQVSAFHRGL